jgi:AbrB family looped-hinge helix DNA binding protein
MAMQVYASKAEIVGIMRFPQGEMLQFPTMRDLFEILHREWPVIKAAPYSFFISLIVIAGIIWAVFELRYRKRLESRSGIEDAAASSSVSDSGNSTATGGNATAKIGDIHHNHAWQKTNPMVGFSYQPMATQNPTLEYLTTTKIGEKGQLTVPKEFRQDLGLGTGAPFAVLRLGDGLILLPEQRRFELLCQRVSATLTKTGLTPDDLLATLPKARNRVYTRRYGKSQAPRASRRRPRTQRQK